MEYGVHLPLIDFNGEPFTLERLSTYTEKAVRLGFKTITAHDHLVFPRPWLDGLIALTAIIQKSGNMALGTTVSLPVLRGPVPLAKALAAVDILSGGRLFVGVGSGSSSGDYKAVGIPFEERWKRLDEAIVALRTLLKGDAIDFNGRFYSTQGVILEPKAFQNGGPPIWIGSWGYDTGLRRVARLGDGWLASAYHNTPELFKSDLEKLKENLIAFGRDPDSFPNAIASNFYYITDDWSKAERIVSDFLSPALKLPNNVMMERFLIGSAQKCAEKLASYREAGAQQILLWPVTDEIRQLDIFIENVAPLVQR
ncbi:MAG: LLM class flavin-dependent oxidoreductase [Thermodesulfobacteriota bacterium]